MKKKKQSLLWKISHPDKPSPSYIFGTMHIKDVRAFHLMERVKEKINEVDALANEFHFADLETGGQKDAMSLPEGMSLEGLMKPKDYQRIEKLVEEELGLPITVFADKLPLLLTNAFAEKFLASEMPVSLDYALYQYALEQGKQTLGIETYAEQMETLEAIPLKYQVKSLIKTTKKLGKYQKDILKLCRLYEASAIDKLYATTKDSLGGMRKLLLYNRNYLMAERIGGYVAEQSMVAAIGAAHLWGKKGVLRLLKQQGIKVKPL